MLTYAATMPGDVTANVAVAQADPFLKKHVAGWGKPGDWGILAVDESGAARSLRCGRGISGKKGREQPQR